MAWGVRWYLVGSVVLGVLGVLAGCSGGNLFAEREPWRHEAEVQCINAGAVKEGAGIVRIKAINGPGMCGADFPLQGVGRSARARSLGFSDDLRPPGASRAARDAAALADAIRDEAPAFADKRRRRHRPPGRACCRNISVPPASATDEPASTHSAGRRIEQAARATSEHLRFSPALSAASPSRAGHGHAAQCTLRR